MSEGDGSQTLGHARAPTALGAWSRLDGYITPVGFCGWKARQEGGELGHHVLCVARPGERRGPLRVKEAKLLLGGDTRCGRGQS